MHGAALDRPGPHQRDLHHEVVEALRPRAQQHLHLRARLDLEHADGVRGLDLGVHLGGRRAGCARGRGARPWPGSSSVTHDSTADSMPEPEQVDLEEAGVGAGVLVPLADRAPGHRRGLQRHQAVERPVGDHHAAGVLREVAREAGDLARQRRRGRGSAGRRRARRRPAARRSSSPTCGGVPAVGRGGQPRDVARRQAERLAELADGAARPVGGEGADERGLPRAVALVHAHDQPLADVAREVEVDVGDARELLVQEAPQREPRLDGVDVREAR